MFEINCAVCGPIIKTNDFETAINYRIEYENKNNNLHQCVIIEKKEV